MLCGQANVMIRANGTMRLPKRFSDLFSADVVVGLLPEGSLSISAMAITEGGVMARINRAGEIRIPALYIRAAKLQTGQLAVAVGVSDRIEIWADEEWKKESSKKTKTRRKQTCRS